MQVFEGVATALKYLHKKKGCAGTITKNITLVFRTAVIKFCLVVVFRCARDIDIALKEMH